MGFVTYFRAAQADLPRAPVFLLGSAGPTYMSHATVWLVPLSELQWVQHDLPGRWTQRRLHEDVVTQNEPCANFECAYLPATQQTRLIQVHWQREEPVLPPDPAVIVTALPWVVQRVCRELRHCVIAGVLYPGLEGIECAVFRNGLFAHAQTVQLEEGEAAMMALWQSFPLLRVSPFYCFFAEHAQWLRAIQCGPVSQLSHWLGAAWQVQSLLQTLLPANPAQPRSPLRSWQVILGKWLTIGCRSWLNLNPQRQKNSVPRRSRAWWGYGLALGCCLGVLWQASVLHKPTQAVVMRHPPAPVATAAVSFQRWLGWPLAPVQVISATFTHAQIELIGFARHEGDVTAWVASLGALCPAARVQWSLTAAGGRFHLLCRFATPSPLRQDGP